MRSNYSINRRCKSVPATAIAGIVTAARASRFVNVSAFPGAAVKLNSDRFNTGWRAKPRRRVIVFRCADKGSVDFGRMAAAA